jgi:peptidylprolyl isomerase
VGTGERGRGHIGYFIRPEFSETVKHEVGTVGFWHDEDPGTAGCRLYITLNPAPALDGEFTIIGKVTRGLDIVSSIANRPVINTENYPEKEIPRNPIKIQQVTFTADR